MSMNLVTLLYLAASVCFIQALKGLSHPTTSIRGNLFGMIGMAAVFIAVAAVAEPYAFGIVGKGEPIPSGNRLELFLGAAIGAITFSGSVVAFGKLSGTYKFRLFKGAPVVFPGQHKLNLVLGLLTIGLG